MYNYENAMAFISGFTKHGKPVTDLSRFEGLMNSLGNPQDKLKFVHFAGTNGKGSTVRFCAASLIEAGYKVGEFTSPFITDYTDRIRICNINISKESVAEYAQAIEKVIGDNRSFSQFEITAAIAFMYFFNEKCDIICLETGVGGLLDCTNIIKNTLISVITSISFDHTKLLGDTLDKIAGQKAGIIKPNSNVVLSADNLDEVISIVSRQAENKYSSFVIPNTSNLEVIKCDISGSKFIYDSEEYNIKMAGRHQISNALSAVEAMRILNINGFYIPKSAVRKGLSGAFVSARAEIISQKPLIMIDGAHNPSGAKSLAGILRTMVTQKPIIMIVGMLAEKNVASSVSEFCTAADKVICVDDFLPGAIDSGELADLFHVNGKSSVIAADIKAAVNQAELMAGDNGAVVICGSLYLASEVRKYIFPV